MFAGTAVARGVVDRGRRSLDQKSQGLGLSLGTLQQWTEADDIQADGSEKPFLVDDPNTWCQRLLAQSELVNIAAV